MKGMRLFPQVKNSRKEWHRRAQEATEISREISAKYAEALQDIHAVIKERDRKFFGIIPRVVITANRLDQILGKYRLPE